MGVLIQHLRRSILGIVDYVNENAKTNIQCEVFGTFNTSELAIVWLGDEYEDILQMIEYIKHLSVQVSDEQTREDGISEREVTNAFMTTFSIVSAQMKLDLTKDYNFRGDALVQVSFNDECADMAAINVLKREIQKICIEEGTEGSINYDTSVGEFDWLVRCPASTILKLLNPKSKFKMLLPGEREKGGSGRYIIEQECRKILRNNTRLLIGTEGNQLLKEMLENISPDYYVCRIDQK